MEEKIKGIVKFFDPKKGTGFILGPDSIEGRDVFVHYSFIEMEGFKTLQKNQEVSYVLVLTDRGPQAHHVTPL